MSTLALGSVRDMHLDYKLKRVFIPAQSTVAAQVTGASTVLVSGYDATLIYAQLGSTNLSAVRFTTTAQLAPFAWQLPYDFDNGHRLFIRHLWTSGYGTANGTATFTNLFNTMRIGDAATLPATVMTFAAGASTKVSATANTLYWSPYSYIAPIATGSVANQTFAQNAEILNVTVGVSAVTGITLASDFVYWLGAEIAYTPNFLYGDGSRREARQMLKNLDPISQQIPANQI